MSFMLLSHVLASLCLYISSKTMHSYIPNPCGTPSVSYASLFQVVSSSDIISKWLISMWCQQGKEDYPSEVCNDQKTTSDIYKW
jgi:L-ribulose-5-phosphate 3-epimerase UlaE